MRKYKDVLRLKYIHHLANCNTGNSCAMAHIPVTSVLIWLDMPVSPGPIANPSVWIYPGEKGGRGY